ncbi:MAG: glycosyltransferase [Planctomycetota bacterium]
MNLPLSTDQADAPANSFVIAPSTSSPPERTAPSERTAPPEPSGPSEPIAPACEHPVQQPIVTDLKVLHLVNGEHFSGAERVQSHLGRCLPRFGIQADFACLKPGRFAHLVDQQAGHWGHAYRLAMRNKFDVRVAWQVRDLIRNQGYGLIDAHTPRCAMIASIASRLAGIPWVYHIHSPAARDSSRRLTNQLNNWVEHASLFNVAHRITVSESLREECLQERIRPFDVSVVWNGVPAVCPPRSSIPVPGQGTWTIGMVALMRPRKGLEVVLDALAICRDRGTRVRLRCIGPFETSGYEQGIYRKIDELRLGDLVDQVGFTDNVPAELAKLDAMVLPSLFGEGLPMVVLEAMAAGLPVIATEVEGTPEAIRDGKDGLLALPNDPCSLAEHIIDLVGGKHDWQAMSQSAKDRHQQYFSDHAMANRTAQVYRLVMARRQRRCATPSQRTFGG